MAKWGEGDPRWIVEERPDATNVNNWHWSEKNADAWSKKKLNELFTNSVLEEKLNNGSVTMEAVEKCEGEARANNRKAKLIFFYEWELTLKWKYEPPADSDAEEVRGTITIPNLSEEHTDMKDVDIEVAITSSPKAKEASAAKDFLRKGVGAGLIRKKLQNYVDSLKTEYSQGLILPKASTGGDKTTGKTVINQAPPPTSPSKSNAKSTASAMKSLDIGSTSSSSSVKVQVGSISMKPSFKCTGMEIYNALTQKEMLQAFTCGPVTMKESKAGEEFELLGGSIKGKFLELKPFSQITQTWRLKSWPEGHFSKVVMNINQTAEETNVEVTQTNVPTKEIDSTRAGWDRYYWEAIKRSFGFGAMLF